MKNMDDILLSSVPLHLLNDKTVPIDFGTGCIIDMPECDYLFTVFHVANNTMGRWGIAKEYITGKGLEYVIVGQFTFQCLINVNTLISTNIEFAFTKIPYKYDYLHQEIIPPGNISNSKKKNKYTLQQIKLPAKNKIYGFAGHTKPQIFENYAIDTEYMLHLDYKFLGTNEWTYIFEPPVEHPGDEFYKGCSGAPIIDEENNVVSLLVSGDQKKNEIYGVNLEKALIGFNIEIGNN